MSKAYNKVYCLFPVLFLLHLAENPRKLNEGCRQVRQRI